MNDFQRGINSAFLGVVALLVAFYVSLLLSGATFFTWEKFVQVLGSPNFRQSLWLSFWTASLATILAMSIGVPTAYALSRSKFIGKDLVDTLLDLPIILSPVATGTLLLIMFQTSPGKSIQNTGLVFVYTQAGIVLAQFTIIVSLAVRLLKSTFDSIPKRYEDLSRLLGCSPWRTFCRVSLPIARPGIIASLILCWARAFGEFGATVTLAGAMPRRTETIPTGIFLRLGVVDLEGAVILIGVLVFVCMSVLLTLRYFSGKLPFK